MVRIGQVEMKNINVGTTNINKILKGTQLIWERNSDYNLIIKNLNSETRTLERKYSYGAGDGNGEEFFTNDFLFRPVYGKNIGDGLYIHGQLSKDYDHDYDTNISFDYGSVSGMNNNGRRTYGQNYGEGFRYKNKVLLMSCEGNNNTGFYKKYELVNLDTKERINFKDNVGSINTFTHICLYKISDNNLIEYFDHNENGIFKKTLNTNGIVISNNLIIQSNNINSLITYDIKKDHLYVLEGGYIKIYKSNGELYHNTNYYGRSDNFERTTDGFIGGPNIIYNENDSGRYVAFGLDTKTSVFDGRKYFIFDTNTKTYKIKETSNETILYFFKDGSYIEVKTNIDIPFRGEKTIEGIIKIHKDGKLIFNKTIDLKTDSLGFQTPERAPSGTKGYQAYIYPLHPGKDGIMFIDKFDDGYYNRKLYRHVLFK